MTIMKDCTGIICKMKTYKQLKEEALDENFMEPVTNFVLGKPVSNKPPADVARQSAGYDYGPDTRRGGVFGKGGYASQGMDFLKNNKGLLGAGLAGTVALAGIAGLLKTRQSRQTSPRGGIPAPNLQSTQAATTAPVGTPTQRVTRAVQKIDPNVKPIDNRTSMT